MKAKDETNSPKKGTVRLIRKKQVLTDNYAGQRVTLHTLTETVLAFHYQRNFIPLYDYVVYSRQLNNLSKTYTLEQLQTAITKSAINAKASWGIASIKQFLPEVVDEELEAPEDYLAMLTANWSI